MSLISNFVIPEIVKFIGAGALGNFTRELMSNRIAKKYLAPCFEKLKKDYIKFRAGLVLALFMGGWFGYLLYNKLGTMGFEGLIFTFFINLGLFDFLELVTKNGRIQKILEYIIKKEVKV